MTGRMPGRCPPKAVAAEPEPSLRAETQREAPIDDLQARLDAIRAVEEAS